MARGSGGAAVALIGLGAAILIPTLTFYSACGLLAQFIPLDCLASTALSFVLAFVFIGLGIALALAGLRE